MGRLLSIFRRGIDLWRCSGFFGVVEALLSTLLAACERRQTSKSGSRLDSIDFSEVINFLRDAGVREGDTIFVHSSWDSVRTCNVRPSEIIKLLRDLIGGEGTIAMPAYKSTSVTEVGSHFEVDTEATKAGLIAEVFRRTEGVQRSCSPLYSVCALGPQAGFLLDSHSRSQSAWDEFSPYLRLAAIPRSWIIGLGVGPAVKVASSQHVVESILIEHPYFKKLFRTKLSFSYNSKRYGHGYGVVRISSSVNNSMKLRRGYAGLFKEIPVGKMTAYAIRVDDLILATLDMALRGRTMYIWPVPWFWLFLKSRRADARVILNRYLERIDSPQ